MTEDDPLVLCSWPKCDGNGAGRMTYEYAIRASACECHQYSNPRVPDKPSDAEAR